MPSNAASILALLQNKLASLNIDPSAADRAAAIDVRIVDNLLKTVEKLSNQDVFDFEEVEEVYESLYKGDARDAVYEDETDSADPRESFSYEYICKVLDFYDGPPKKTFKLLRHRFPRVKDTTYLTRFRTYRENLGTSHEKYLKIAQFTKEMFDDARAKGVLMNQAGQLAS